MDEIIKALLAGASDQEILEMLDRLGEDEGENRDDGKAEADYGSCVKVAGAPILPPVMTEERRLECLKWRRKALEVEEKIGNKRREALTDNINRIVSGVTNRNNSESDGLEVYSILRSNSRTADVIINSNFEDDSERPTAIDLVSHSPEPQPQPVEMMKPTEIEEKMTPSCKEDDNSQSQSLSAKSKTFEEIKKLVKTLPHTPRSARFQSKVLSSGPSSDISDDEETTTASSLKTEAYDDDLFSLRSVTRHKQSPEQSNIYDSMLSVDTVIENLNFKDEDLDPEPRPRRGSYSLSKPSPVLVAYMQKIGKPEEHKISAEKCSVSPVEKSVEWKPRVKPTSPPSSKIVSTRADVTRHRDDFLAAFSKSPSVSKPSKPAVKDEEKELEAELTLELGSVVSTTESCQTTGSETYRTGTTITPSLQLPELTPVPVPASVAASMPEASNGVIPEKLAQAVSRLAVQQQQTLDSLIKQQEVERLRLREEFQRQQQELMAEILSQFPQLQNTVTAREDDPGKMEEVEVELERSVKEISRENSYVSDCSVSLGEDDGEDKENIPTKTNLARKGTFTKQDKVRKPVVVKIPEEAYLHQRAWVRLTAMARGHLTRLLLRTDKVEDIKRTIKETVACAVNLHLESGSSPPSREDLQLHARLLAQIESACQSLHNIFFGLSTAERMNILALNRSARQRLSNSRSKQLEGKKRISAATEARLKTKNSPKVETFNDKRQRVLRNAGHISLQTGKVLSNHKTMTTRSRSSPRIHLRKSKPILSTKIRQSPLLNLDSPYFKRNKPVWK